MAGTGQFPTDYKKFLDKSLKSYLNKPNPVIELFNKVSGDPAKTTWEYARFTQSYAAATGWTALSNPQALADGARPLTEDIGTSDGTATPVTYANSIRVLRKVLNSGDETIKQYLTRASVEQVERIKAYVNTTLISNMSSSAGQSYSASATWAAGGDPVGDVVQAKADFKSSAGGIEADFIALHPNEYADIAKDERFQSTLYTSKSIESGNITPKPFGLDVIVDQAVTTGTFYLGKKGMFADLIVTEDFVTAEVDEGLAGKVYEVGYTFASQFHSPYYVMAGTGI